MACILETGAKLESMKLKSPDHLGNITIVDINKAANFKEYEKIVWQWAKSVWNAWKEYHSIIKQISDLQ